LKRHSRARVHERLLVMARSTVVNDQIHLPKACHRHRRSRQLVAFTIEH